MKHLNRFSPGISAALDELARLTDEHTMHAEMRPAPTPHMLVPESIRPALMEALRHMADTTQSTPQRERALAAIEAMGDGA